MLSVSDLVTTQYCERKLFLQKVLHLKEPQKKSTSLGILNHELLEIAAGMQEKIVSQVNIGMSKADIYEIYFEEYLSIIDILIVENKGMIDKFMLDAETIKEDLRKVLKAEADFMASRTLNYLLRLGLEGRELYKNMPKLISEMPLKSAAFGINGRLDRLEETANEVKIYEIKTGKVPITGFWPGHKTQLISYILLAREQFKKETRGFVYYLETSELKEMAFNPFMALDLKKLINHTKEIILKKDMPQVTENRNKCTHCGLKDLCHDKTFINTKMKEITAQTTLSS